MKLKISLLTLCLSMLLVACNGNQEESIDLIAPVGEFEAEFATTEDEDSSNNTLNDENSLQSKYIDKSANEFDEANGTKANESTIPDNSSCVTIIPSCTPEISVPQPTAAPEVTSVPQPTTVPQVTGVPQPTVEPQPTTAPKPTNAPQPTTAPKPTNAPQPTTAPKPTSVPKPTTAPKPTSMPQPTTVPNPTSTPKPTSAPKPTSTPNEETSSSKLSVRGTTISLGESKSSIINKFGSPNRIDATEYNYEFYVYNNNYKKFMMIGIANDKVVAWYTDSNDFSYDGLSGNSGVSNINKTFGKSFSLKNTLSVKEDDTKITFFMDTLGDGTVEGIYVAGSGVSNSSTTKSVLTAWEKEVFDLTNSFRARNGYSALTWSNEAAKAARLHSEDMAENNYFSHNGLDGSTPFDRMKRQGITYKSAGENIIGGYGNAMFSNIGWVNSSGHRKNLLNSSYTHLGVGFTLGGSYGNYGTQNFFGK